MGGRFQGLVAWVTGGGSGLGRALALELAGQGARVAVSGRRGDRIREVEAELNRRGQEGMAIPCDVTDEEQVKAAVEAVVARWGRLDIAVANAGYGVVAPFLKVGVETWRRQLEVNVVGVVATLRQAMPELKKTRGRAVVVSSVMGKLALGSSAPYSASKHALVGLCDALYQELQGTGVTITNILPGLVATEIAQVDNHGVFHAQRRDERPKALMWPADRAARVMARAIHRRPRQFVFTGHGRLGVFLVQHVPGLVYALLRRVRLG
jgi:NAD(P)-dependent dehydrogenase (short-subunit alcohol dehydrogenase family)